MKIVYTGLESSGKTLILAYEAMDIFARNKRWQKKYGFTRKVYSNIRFAPHVEEKYGEFIEYWQDYRELLKDTKLKKEEIENMKKANIDMQDKDTYPFIPGIDIIFDEISTHFSALKREPLHSRVNQWLRQGAKNGVHIYATAQEYHDIHNDFRRRVKIAYNMTKIIGSRRSGVNMPPVKRVWGLCIKREMDIHPYNELEPSYGFPVPFRITKRRTSVFDTNQTIKGSGEIPYEHVVKECILPDCKDLPRYKKIIHR